MAVYPRVFIVSALTVCVFLAVSFSPISTLAARLVGGQGGGLHPCYDCTQKACTDQPACSQWGQVHACMPIDDVTCTMVVENSDKYCTTEVHTFADCDVVTTGRDCMELWSGPCDPDSYSNADCDRVIASCGTEHDCQPSGLCQN